MKIISIYNIKGGVAKTTTTVSVAGILAEEGKKTLLIDLDPQGNSTSRFKNQNNEDIKKLIDEEKLKSIRDVFLIEEIKPGEVISKTTIENLDIIGANILHSKTELGIFKDLDVGNMYMILDLFLKQLENYDYVIIDCPPTYNMITRNALNTSTEVLIPIASGISSLEGLGMVLDVIANSKKYHNHKLEILGILLTQKENTNIDKETESTLKEMAKNLFLEDNIIRKNVTIKEAELNQLPINFYSKNCHAYEDYYKLTQMILTTKEEKH